MLCWVVLSGENPPLAAAEARAVAEAMDGKPGTADLAPPGCAAVEIPDEARAQTLGSRLALSRRCLAPWPERGLASLAERFRREGGAGQSGAVREHPGTPSGSAGPEVQRLGAAYVAGGGSISLEHPARRFWLLTDAEGAIRIGEELATVDRSSFAERRLSRMPFRRPVTLPPRLARAAVNLARVRPGDRVVDPFVGTGSLLLEAALCGAKVVGVDREAAMIRGTLQNFRRQNRAPELLIQDDAEAAAERFAAGTFSALVTDPPYGRASGSGGEPVGSLLERVLPVWGRRIRSGGRLVLIGPPTAPDPGVPWRCRERLRDRVHRSLVREFRVYQRAGESGPVSAP
jgi:tRNA (guanine10-N2)-dimethyltransferase